MSVEDAIRKLVSENKIVIFMKGTPQMPQCGFSAATVEALKGLGQPFHAVNVLTDPGMREGVKAFTSWPTIPQVFVRGKFIGGCDIVREMSATGELQKLVTQAP